MKSEAMKASGARRREGGFTLLEVMVALAILALALTTLVNIVTSNVRAAAHARATTIATFLARGKMVAFEDVVLEKGFQELDETSKGDFDEFGYPTYTWECLVEKVELPTEASQMAQKAAGDKSKSSDPSQMLSGVMGGLLSGFIEPIRVGLQESVRRVTVKVSWDEPGRPNQTMEVVTYLTDPAKLDVAMALGQAGLGATGTGTGSGSSSSSSSSTGGKK
jgi:general secretion pathway protein I